MIKQINNVFEKELNEKVKKLGLTSSQKKKKKKKKKKNNKKV